MGKFKKDLETGHIYEKRSLLYLDYDNYNIIEGYHKEYDIEIFKDGNKIKIEVKSDKMASLTNNLAIEYECNNKASGITSTTADFWVYFIIFEDREECYKIPIEELKELVKDCKQVSGGDGMRSKMYLLNKSKVLKYLIDLQRRSNYLIYSKNKFDNNYIIPSMNDQQPTTNDERPLSYSKRLFNYIKDANLETYSINEIEIFINDFSKMEYNKKKEKTDEMPFGKYKFRKVKDVASFDKQYLRWLVKQSMMDNWEELKEEINKVI